MANCVSTRHCNEQHNEEYVLNSVLVIACIHGTIVIIVIISSIIVIEEFLLSHSPRRYVRTYVCNILV